MSASHLGSERVNLLELREWLRRELLSFFEDCNGKKLIVWDNQLTQPLGLIADYKVLKERGVEKMMDLRQMSPLKSKDVQDVSHIFFIVKPKLELMKIIAESIKSLETDSKGELTKECHIIFVPRKSHLCEKKLKELGVFGNFKDNLKEFFLDLIPLEYDLLSMENPEIYRDCFLFNDYTYLFHIAKSLMTIQTLYGVIPNVYGKGKCAKQVAEQIFRMRRELPANQEPQITPKIDNLILIDRSVDYITPMMCQLTYEGLIDENFGIKYTQFEFPQDKVKSTDSASKVNVVDVKKSIVILNSADTLHGEIRDRNFNAVNHVLSRTAKELQQANDAKSKLSSVSEIRMFVEKTLKTYQAKKTSLENHMSITEIIRDITGQDEFYEKLHCQNELLAGMSLDKPNSYIMAFISQNEDIYKVLRLICLHCIVNSGFKPPLLETYKREILRAYGFSHFGLLQNMEKISFLFPQTQKIFSIISPKLNLVVDNVSEDNPNDISYVFSGYAPLSVRFCQYLTKPNWKAYADTFGLLPGPFLEETQRLPNGIRKRRNSNTSINSSQSALSMDQKMTLVYFIGGCSYAEISAFRYLSESTDSNSEFIVATTCIINGKNLISSLQD